ncbi:MAG: hypothetical protein IPK19_15110 [Chloroflexi bacterium]|nr:hypothetical protein [Chloroflexota bacterium]
MTNRKLILPMVIALCLLIGGLAYMSVAFFGNPTTVAARFLYAAIEGDEITAREYMSSSLKAAVQQECDGGNVTSCIDWLIPDEWGSPLAIRFVFGSGSNQSELYYGFWPVPAPVSMVISLGSENGKEVVTGWRGFILSEGENPDMDLLEGDNLVNQFPRIDFTGVTEDLNRNR